MGREIRRVPPDWEHPRRPCEYFACAMDDQTFPIKHRNSRWHGSAVCPGNHFVPLYDRSYEEASKDYASFLIRWYARDFQATQETEAGQYLSEEFFEGNPWDWTAPPDQETHRERTWTPEEATHFQMYETVSEGTPVSPIFPTLQDLEDYLVTREGYTRPQAAGFCRVGSAPSFVMERHTDGTVTIKDPVESSEDLHR